MLLIILSLVSFLISLLAVAFIKDRLSQQLLDIPNERSAHTQPTPRGGGLGFIIAFAITSAIAVVTNISSMAFFPLWLALIPLIIIGIIDDLQGVPIAVRYLVQLLSASVAVAYFGAFPQPWLSRFGMGGEIIALALTIIGITFIVNFYNFMDGLDGLVAGCSALQLSFLAIYFHQPILWLLVAALLGFLWWNWSPAKIFMGDSGSTFLGATITIALLERHSNAVSAWSALAIALPLLGDAIYTFCSRLWRGENILQAHRSHLFQRVQQSGWSHAQVAISYISLNLLVAVSIDMFGVIAAWGSLVAILLAIILTEVYLQSHQTVKFSSHRDRDSSKVI